MARSGGLPRDVMLPAELPDCRTVDDEVRAHDIVHHTAIGGEAMTACAVPG